MQPATKLFKEKVSMREKLIFAAGDLYGGGAPSLINALYFGYLVAMGVGTVWAGAIVAIGRVWDAVSDPIMGVLSDNTRTKWGRRRPYILFGSMLIIASFAFLFLPLPGAGEKTMKIIVYLFAYLFYNTLSTVIGISYTSFSAELATTPRETTQVNTLRLIFSMFSSALATVGGAYLLTQFIEGKMNVNTLYFIVVFGFGAAYTIPSILTGLFTRERVALPETRSTFTLKTFVEPFRVRAFVYLLLGYLFAYVCMDLLTTNVVYFASYAVAVDVGGEIILAIIVGVIFVTLPLYYLLLARGVPKPFLFRVGIPVYILGIVLLTMVPLTSLKLLIIFCALVGLGMGGSQLLPWVIFPDIIDIAELKLANRPTGSFSGVMIFMKKTSSAIAIFLSGVVLRSVGFNEPKADEITGTINYADFVQPESAVLGLKLLIMVSVIVFMSVAYLSMRKLKLTTAVSERVKELIEKRNRGEAFDEKDQSDLAQLERDFF